MEPLALIGGKIMTNDECRMVDRPLRPAMLRSKAEHFRPHLERLRRYEFTIARGAADPPMPLGLGGVFQHMPHALPSRRISEPQMFTHLCFICVNPWLQFGK